MEDEISIAVMGARDSDTGMLDKNLLVEALDKIEVTIKTKGENDAFPWTVSIEGYIYTINDPPRVDFVGREGE